MPGSRKNNRRQIFQHGEDAVKDDGEDTHSIATDSHHESDHNQGDNDYD